MRDPQTPVEWQAAVNAAHALLVLDSARQYGLVTGGRSSRERTHRRGTGVSDNGRAQALREWNHVSRQWDAFKRAGYNAELNALAARFIRDTAQRGEPQFEQRSTATGAPFRVFIGYKR